MPTAEHPYPCRLLLNGKWCVSHNLPGDHAGAPGGKPVTDAPRPSWPEDTPEVKCDRCGEPFGAHTLSMAACPEGGGVFRRPATTAPEVRGHAEGRTCAEVEAKLADVHDALHAECDGTADLPAEIRTLRTKLAEAERRVEEWQARCQEKSNDKVDALQKLAEAERERDEARQRTETAESVQASMTVAAERAQDALAAAESREKALAAENETLREALDEIQQRGCRRDGETARAARAAGRGPP